MHDCYRKRNVKTMKSLTVTRTQNAVEEQL